MSVKVGTLSIDLVANTAAFTGSMSKMSQLSAKTANDVKKSLEKIAAAGIAMGAAVATGTAALIRHSIDSADALNDLANSAGTTTEWLSKFSYAAGGSEQMTQAFGTALQKLSQSALNAQNGNIQLINGFRNLGVAFENSNGHLRDSGEIMADIAKKFGETQDGAGKTAVAMLLLGRSGAQIIPHLDRYGQEQAQLNAEAEKFGFILHGNVAQAAGDVNDNIDRLHAVVKGFGLTLMSATVPAVKTLTDELVQLAKDANIPELARSFGDTVTSSIRAVGDGLQFAAKHATELKIALEALAALQVVRIGLPILAQLSSGTLLAGIGKLATGLLGLQKVIPVLANISKWLIAAIPLLGEAGGATYVLGGAVAALGGPVTVIAGAVAALSAALYYFRDTTFSVSDSVYKLKDAYSALWSVIKQGGQTALLSGTAGVQFGAALDQAKNTREAAEKKIFTDAAAKKAQQATDTATSKFQKQAAQIDTAGLGTPLKDYYGEALQKLNLAIAAQKSYLNLLDASPEAIQQATAAEKAHAQILQLNNALIDAARPGLTAQQKANISNRVALQESLSALNEYGKSIVDQQHSTELSIQQTEALTAATAGGDEAVRRATISNILLGLTFNKTADEIKAMTPELEKLQVLLNRKSNADVINEASRGILAQQNATELSIQQTKALAAAMLEGDAATQKATVDNAILALTYGKTAEQIKALTPALDRLKATLTSKANADLLLSTNRDLAGLQDQLAAQQGMTEALLQGENAYRQAALAARLYTINQQIAESTDKDVRAALEAKRQAIIALTLAEYDEADARDAISLQSPLKQYREETDALNRQIGALTDHGKKSLDYLTSLQVAAKAQDNFNRATEDTINLLLTEGTAEDGVKAFFLRMQEQAKTTGAIIFDALNSAFDKLSDNLAKLVTGGKADFAQMFRDLGEQIAKDTFQSQLQKGLGALGKKLGISLPGLQGKPDGSQNNPFYVVSAGAGLTGLPGGGDNEDDPTGKLTSTLKDAFGKIGDFFKNIFSSLGSLIKPIISGAGKAFQFIGGLIPHADGGPLDPSRAYLVGERGPEILTGISGNITSNAASQRLLSNSSSGPTIYVDARGSQNPGMTAAQTKRAVHEAYSTAVQNSVAAQQELRRRSPRSRFA